MKHSIGGGNASYVYVNVFIDKNKNRRKNIRENNID